MFGMWLSGFGGTTIKPYKKHVQGVGVTRTRLNF